MLTAVVKTVSFSERLFYSHLYPLFILRNFNRKAVTIKNKTIEKDIGQAQEEATLNSGSPDRTRRIEL
jgi:hypothetical protein